MRHFIHIIENVEEEGDGDMPIQPGVHHIDELPAELHEQAVEAFDALANSQRHGPPEKLGGASLRNRGIQVSGLYSELTEHVGDITNRMAKHWDHYRGSTRNVEQKVGLGMRRINPHEFSFGFGDDILGQVKRNYTFMSHPDREKEYQENKYESRQFTGTLADWMKWWKEAGARYADAHAALTVWNEAQWHAREAAVCSGRLEWKAAYDHLAALHAHLESSEAWEAYAGQVSIDGSGHLVPFKS